MSARRRTLTAALFLLATGCATVSSPRSGETQAAPSKVSLEQRHLAADGTVPFVDEQATDRDFAFTPDPPPNTAGAKPCHADQVRAQLDHWYRQGEGDNEGGRRPPPGVYGWVSFTAANPTVRCTLQGQPKTQLLIDGHVVPLRNGDSITEASKKVVTLVSQDSSADLRIDWSPPFCDPPGRQQLHVTLPHQGGEVTANVLKPRTPACAGGSTETGTQLRSYLSPSAFTQHQRPTVLNSPLAALKATVIGAPTRAVPGQLLRFRVRLTNPTGTAIPLDPCPGFLLERFIQGTAGRAGLSTAQLYRLNCRPVSSIAARGILDFQMQAVVPRDPPGAILNISWRLIARGLGSGAWCHFDAALAT